MSLNLCFNNDLFQVKQLALPSRYFYFKEEQNYLKLLTIGEGFFPKDRIRTTIELNNSDVVCTTESATKIYPSSKEFAISKIDVKLDNSNFEFINDELILHKDSKFIQILNFYFDTTSTFFYADILSHGRSFENFDFDSLGAKNSFVQNSNIEYLEKYIFQSSSLHKYLIKMKSKKKIFAKVYLKSRDNNLLMKELNDINFKSFSFTKSKAFLIGVISGNSMASLKRELMLIWHIYRQQLGKKEFNLGKQ